VVVVAAAALAWAVRRNAARPVAPIDFAVLHFARTGDSAVVNRVAMGLVDDIRMDLGRLDGLIVPSAFVTSRYAADSLPFEQLVQRMRAEAVLRGSVHEAGGGVRVDAELYDVAARRALWSRSYESSELPLAEVEREIVRSVISKLGLRTTDAQRRLFANPVTADARAYDLFLQGRAMELAVDDTAVTLDARVAQQRRSQALYTQARNLDPQFAVARARLALMQFFAASTYDTTAARREQVRLDAETAIRLQPELSEAHYALAGFHFVDGNMPASVAEADRAIEFAPNNATRHLFRGIVLTRAGRLEDAAADFERAMQLDPGSVPAVAGAAQVYGRLRRIKQAMHAYDRMIELDPTNYDVRLIKGHATLRWEGTADTLAATLRIIPAEWDPDGMVTYSHFTVLWTQRRYDEALTMLQASRSALSREVFVYHPISLMRARIYDWMGDSTKARAEYAVARRVLEDSAAAHPRSAQIRVSLGLANAGLGRNAEAIRDAQRTLELAPVTDDAPTAMAFMGMAAQVYARAGANDRALELLELLFSMPAGREVTVPFLRVYPAFDPLRSDSRFDDLLKRFALPDSTG
jgi:tetratricopeptide (TPR) repeat protein